MTIESIWPRHFRATQWGFLHHPKFPMVVLALSMLVTVIAWGVSSAMVQRNIEERFIRHTDDLAAAIEARLLTYETTLRGGAGLFKSTNNVSREQWRTYVRNLDIQQALPGIQGIGFSRMLTASQVDKHLLEVRASGFTEYAIRPPGKRDPTTSIVYLEPFDWRNQRAFGYDMYAEPVRRAAMIKAMETAQPAMSGRVNLVQETDEARQHGFLVYVPVYRSNMPTETVAERRAALHGFVYSPFRVGDLMAGIAGSKRQGIHFELYDGDTENDAAFLYQSISPALLPVADEEPHLFNRQIPITVVGRQWLISAHVTESYGNTGEITIPTIVAAVGLVINLTLFLTFYALRRQQRQLEKSHAAIAKLSLAVEQNPHSIVITELNGTVSYVNPAFSKTTGYAPDEIIGKNQRILQSGQTPESTYADLWSTLQRGEPWHGRFINRRKDGSYYTDQSLIAPIRSEADGRITHYLAIKEDISRQELTSQKLSHTEERLRLALQATREVIWDWNILTDQQIWNETGAEIFGWHDIVNEPQPAAWWFDRVHPDDRERLTTAFHRVVEDSALDSWQDEYRFQRSDGTFAHVLDRGLVVRDPSGKPVRMVGSMLDISELIQARQQLEIQQAHLEHIVAERTAELKSSEQRIKLILASTADGIIGTDRIGVINFVNPAAERLLGYPAGSLIGLSINHTLLHRHAGEAGGKSGGDSRNPTTRQGQNDVSNVEETFWCADGEALPVEYSCRTILEGDAIHGFVFGFTDIRARKAADIARNKALADAEHLAHIKSEFLANMSHEIRTPLNAVIASAMMMESDMVNPKQRERLTRIIDSSQHLLRLISDILDFSKIDAGRIDIETTDFTLRAVIDLVASQSVEIAARKGVDWQTRIDPELPATLRGDPMRLGQILLNFSSNALKFTEHGHVTLHARLLEETADNLRVRFEVQDSGRGFDPSRTDTLFEAFIQEDSSTTREFGGTGLGLAISKKIAELMGGRIGAESVPDAGSTFWVEIPFTRSANQHLPDTAPMSFHGKRTIVLGSDERQTKAIEAQLSHLEIDVRRASTADELATRVESAWRVGRPYDIVFGVGNKDEIAAFCEPGLQMRLRDPAQQPPLRCVVMLALADRQGMDVPLARGCVDALLPLAPSDAEVEQLLGELLGNAPDAGAQAASAWHGRTTGLRRFGQCRLLLAEDNPVNQAVALDMLETFGLTADIADNGREAVTLAENRRYDLILMDMQMPVMGGLEATREIRRLPGYAPVPIIALTANAFESDRQACLAVGMNDFLGKPVVPEALQRTLRQWLGEPAAEAPGDLPEPGAPTDLAAAELPDIPGVNLKAGLAQMSGKRTTFLRLLGQLIEMHGQDAETIRNKLATGDLEGGRRVAHSLKGSAGMLGAEAVSATASRIEKAVHKGLSSEEIDTGLNELDRHFNAIRHALKEIR